MSIVGNTAKYCISNIGIVGIISNMGMVGIIDIVGIISNMGIVGITARYCVYY